MTTTTIPRRAARPADGGRPASKPGRRKPPQKPKWQQQLTWAAAGCRAGESRPGDRASAGRRPAKSGTSLTRAPSGDAGRPVLLFLQRETKANGQFGKLKQLNLRPYEVSRLVGRGRRRDSQSPAGLSRRGKPSTITTATRRPASRRPSCPRACSSSSCPSSRPRSGWRGRRRYYPSAGVR